MQDLQFVTKIFQTLLENSLQLVYNGVSGCQVPFGSTYLHGELVWQSLHAECHDQDLHIRRSCWSTIGQYDLLVRCCSEPFQRPWQQHLQYLTRSQVHSSPMCLPRGHVLGTS